MKKVHIIRWIRNVVQILSFFVIPALFSQAFSGCKEALAAIGSGEALAWTSFSVRLVILCGLTIVAGRIFCGWLCAFGAVGDWIYQFSQFVQKKTKKKLPAIPEKAVHWLQKVKYIVLLLALFVCFAGGSRFITKYSPWTVFSLLTAGNFQIGAYGIGIALLLLIVVGMVFHERFFCQFLCPMGAVFSLLPELPFTSFKRNREGCIPNCQACRRQCPVQIKVGEDPVQAGECIRCGKCMAICPRSNIQWIRWHRQAAKKSVDTPQQV